MLLHCHRFALDKTRSQNLGQNNRSPMLTLPAPKSKFAIIGKLKRWCFNTHSDHDIWWISGLIAGYCHWSLVFYPLFQPSTNWLLISNRQFRLASAVYDISVQLLVPDLSNTELFFVGNYLHGISPLKLKGYEISIKRSVFPDVKFRPLNWTRLNRNKSN